MTTREHGPSGTSRMTRRKLCGGVALSGLALSSVGTASTSLATAPPAGLTPLSLNENPFGPSPLAVRAIQNALTEIARYAGDNAHALEQLIAECKGVSPDQIVLGEILDSLSLLALDGSTGGEFHLFRARLYGARGCRILRFVQDRAQTPRQVCEVKRFVDDRKLVDGLVSFQHISRVARGE